MLRKMILLQPASMCWTIIGPTTQNPPLVRSCRAIVGPTTVLQGPVFQKGVEFGVIKEKKT